MATRSHEEEDRRVKESHPQALRAAASLGLRRDFLILVPSDWQEESWTNSRGVPPSASSPGDLEIGHDGRS